ncbi:MAG: hypothetical protein ACE37B_10470 [Ilumatobacter sp.]|jgi:hypothetical protein|uniref:hypothetical protein n=1 Tax=Ilumatobacter sp. TaxID=1967498 RepID=UPI00391A94F6
MITTGSKFLIGASVLATVMTVVYGIAQDGVMGTIGLTSASVVLIVLATLNVMLRDSNVFVDSSMPAESTASAQRAPANSVWPLAFAFGGVVFVVGLVSYQAVTVVGLVLLLVAGAEWVVQAWAERASNDPHYNNEVRSRLSNALEYPVGAAIGIGVIVYSFSRVMLWLSSKTNTTIAFSVMAAVILAVAFLFAFKPSIKTGAIGSTMALSAVAIVVAGAAAGVDGEREIVEFETTAVWQAEALAHPEEYAQGAAEGKHPAGLICESPEKFPEADKKASQTVGSKSGAYTVSLLANGELEFDPPGPIEAGATAMAIPRSNPTNIIFRNESPEDRRLSIDLGTVEVEDEATGEMRQQPVQLCTSLIEQGAAQLLTLTVGPPSIAFNGVENANGPGGEEGDGYWIFVPGVDDAKLKLVVS